MYIAVGVNKYLPEANGVLCPPTAPEISASVTKDYQICSLLCSNIQHCGGFNFNKQTGCGILTVYNLYLN